MMAYFEENNLDSSDETFRDLALPFVLSNPDVNTVLYSFNNFSDIETVIWSSPLLIGQFTFRLQ